MNLGFIFSKNRLGVNWDILIVASASGHRDRDSMICYTHCGVAATFLVMAISLKIIVDASVALGARASI